jgi:hypothetical protein
MAVPDRHFYALRSKQIFLLHARFFLGLFFYPEDGGDIFLQNVI